MSAVATARLGRVVDLALLQARRLRGEFALQESDLPAEFDRIVILLAGAEGSRVNPGPGLRVEDVIDRRHGAVMEVWCRCPHAIQRRRLVAGCLLAAELLPEPA